MEEKKEKKNSVEGKEEQKDKKDYAYELAVFCLANFRIVTIKESNEVYIYREGVYEPDGDKKLASYLQRDLDLRSKITIQVVNELLGYIRRLTYVASSELKEPADKICLANGILDLKTLQIIPHNPNMVFFNKLPVKYNPKADCPKIKMFLSQIVNSEDVPILQEIVGYCLYKDYPIQKAIMLLGGGANGKSTYLNLIKAFLGSNNCASISLQSLVSDRFAASSLHGKLANLHADLPSKELKDTGIFKAVTGGDQLTTQKKFKNHFNFTNYSKQIFSANRLPYSPDDTDAFFRRWIIVKFPNQFLEGKANKKLLQELTAEEELSGFLNFAIEGLKKLLKNGEFSNPKGLEAIKQEYLRNSDSVGAFVEDCVIISPDDNVSKEELYADYTDYCRDRRYPIISERLFSIRLKAKVRVEEYRPGEFEYDAVRQRHWTGIKIKKSAVRKKADIADKADGVQEVRDVREKIDPEEENW